MQALIGRTTSAITHAKPNTASNASGNSSATMNKTTPSPKKKTTMIRQYFANFSLPGRECSSWRAAQVCLKRVAFIRWGDESPITSECKDRVVVLQEQVCHPTVGVREK